VIVATIDLLPTLRLAELATQPASLNGTEVLAIRVHNVVVWIASQASSPERGQIMRALASLR
jgi:hypothetical protein